MPDLTGYTGDPLNAFALKFISLLEAERFTVSTTGRGPNPRERKTLRINWGNVYVGQMKADLWGASDPFVCVYRFDKDGSPRKCIAAAPLGFDKLEFAKRYGCNPDQLYVHTDGSGSYLWVRDTETAMVLLRARAKRINEA